MNKKESMKVRDTSSKCGGAFFQREIFIVKTSILLLTFLQSTKHIFFSAVIFYRRNNMIVHCVSMKGIYLLIKVKRQRCTAEIFTLI